MSQRLSHCMATSGLRTPPSRGLRTAASSPSAEASRPASRSSTRCRGGAFVRGRSPATSMSFDGRPTVIDLPWATSSESCRAPDGCTSTPPMASWRILGKRTLGSSGDSPGPRTGRRSSRPRTPGMRSGTSPLMPVFGWIRMRLRGVTAWIGPQMAASSRSDQTLVPQSTTCSVTNCSPGPPVLHGTNAGNYGQGTSRDLAAAWSPGGQAIASVGTMSHPSFRVWGLPHGSVASWVAAFEIAAVAGIPLALGDDFLTLLVRPREFLTSEAKRSRLLRIGALLLLFAFIVAVFQQTALEFLGRAFGGFVIPPPSWFAVMAMLSGALAVIPVAVSVRVFRAAAWKTPRESGATPRIAAKVQGLALLPVVWCLALGCLVWSITLAFGIEDSPALGASLIALFGGVGVLLATRVVSAASGVTFYRSVLALLAVAGVTIGLSFAEFLAVGVHFRELLRSLPLGSGNLYYHLQVLEREGLIVARRDGMYRRFFLPPTSESKIPPGTDRT